MERLCVVAVENSKAVWAECDCAGRHSSSYFFAEHNSVLGAYVVEAERAMKE